MIAGMKAFIGCSGFSYKDWKGVFYPEGMPQKNWFAYYCSQFNCLEINSSFYKYPSEKLLKKWHEESPGDFRFSIKMNRLITHFKKLVDCGRPLNDFYDLVRNHLKEKAGCILFQFPPGFSFNEERLRAILDLSNNGFTNAGEFRNLSWFSGEVLEEFGKAGLIFCGQSQPGELPDDPFISGPAAYYRFHGKSVLFKSRYGVNELKAVAGTLKKAKTSFIFFNNTWGDSAIYNAREMQAIITTKKKGLKACHPL